MSGRPRAMNASPDDRVLIDRPKSAVRPSSRVVAHDEMCPSGMSWRGRFVVVTPSTRYGSESFLPSCRRRPRALRWSRPETDARFDEILDLLAGCPGEALEHDKIAAMDVVQLVSSAC